MAIDEPEADSNLALTLDSLVRVSANVLLQDLGHESVLLDINSGNYFELNAVGTRIWRLLDGGHDLRTSFDAVLIEYDVSAEKLEQDMLMLLGHLAEAGLISIH